tara:strand:+ start:1159 stop:1386 length:228 start_codon:yes stop_codon:yes gene_type:complete
VIISAWFQLLIIISLLILTNIILTLPRRQAGVVEGSIYIKVFLAYLYLVIPFLPIAKGISHAAFLKASLKIQLSV